MGEKRYQKNKNNPKLKLKREEYRLKNKDKIKEWNKKYYQIPKVKKRVRNYLKNRRKTDKNFRISEYLRRHLYKALNKYTKIGKIYSSRKYGIDYNKIIEYLKPFPNDLSNYEIHHIKPLYTFNFINKDGSTNLKEVSKAFSPKNHKWVTIEEHKKIHRELNYKKPKK